MYAQFAIGKLGAKAVGKPKLQAVETKKRKRQVLGVAADKEQDEIELEKMLFGNETIVNDFGGELAKGEDLEDNETALQKLEKKIYEDHGLSDKARSTVSGFQACLLSPTNDLLCVFCVLWNRNRPRKPNGLRNLMRRRMHLHGLTPMTKMPSSMSLNRNGSVAKTISSNLGVLLG
jgi:hypothetical protein